MLILKQPWDGRKGHQFITYYNTEYFKIYSNDNNIIPIGRYLFLIDKENNNIGYLIPLQYFEKFNKDLDSDNFYYLNNNDYNSIYDKRVLVFSKRLLNKDIEYITNVSVLSKDKNRFIKNTNFKLSANEGTNFGNKTIW